MTHDGRSFGSTRPQLLSDLAFESMMSDIIRGRYAIGERLHLDTLADEFGISRTPVREALQRLVMMRFVDITRNSRTIVADWSVRDMLERARTINRIVHFAALAPDAGHRTLDPVNPGKSDLDVYLDVVDHMVTADLVRIGPFIVREFVSPLRKFVEPAVMAAHGLRVESTSSERMRLIQHVLVALGDQDSPAIAAALSVYGEAFIAALTPYRLRAQQVSHEHHARERTARSDVRRRIPV